MTTLMAFPRLLESKDPSLLTSPTAPCFAPAPRDRRVEFGGSVQFMCKPLGRPSPDVKWYKQGQEMGDTGEHKAIAVCTQPTTHGWEFFSLPTITNGVACKIESSVGICVHVAYMVF